MSENFIKSKARIVLYLAYLFAVVGVLMIVEFSRNFVDVPWGYWLIIFNPITMGVCIVACADFLMKNPDTNEVSKAIRIIGIAIVLIFILSIIASIFNGINPGFN
jgi:hypothetical protein